MEKVVISVLSAYLGMGMFFSFYIAPLLFRMLEREKAGSVVENIFPVYFAIGIATVFISLFASFLASLGKKVYLSLGVALILLLILEFYIVPVSHNLKTTDYQAFMRFHTYSVIMNVVTMLLILFSIFLILKRR